MNNEASTKQAGCEVENGAEILEPVLNENLETSQNALDSQDSKNDFAVVTETCKDYVHEDENADSQSKEECIVTKEHKDEDGTKAVDSGKQTDQDSSSEDTKSLELVIQDTDGSNDESASVFNPYRSCPEVENPSPLDGVPARKISQSLPSSPTGTKKRKSILMRRDSEYERKLTRNVSFPNDEKKLVTGYIDAPNPWKGKEESSSDVVAAVDAYQSACRKHNVKPIAKLLEQVLRLDQIEERADSLSLRGQIIDATQCEVLEEIFKRIQFHVLDLENTGLDDDISVTLFDMVEYYDTATHLKVGYNKNIHQRGWQGCARMLRKSPCLETLDLKDIRFEESSITILGKSLKMDIKLSVLVLDNCNLSGRCFLMLMSILKNCSSLRELHLADNKLGVSDAVQVAGMLKFNTKLQLLDLRNNDIQDAGTAHICDGVTTQPQVNRNEGLNTLIMWNNKLTYNSAMHFGRMLLHSHSLETLNIGHNNLSNEGLLRMKDALIKNRALVRLGLQATRLSCEGAIALAEYLAENQVIQRVDLRGNNIRVGGLMALALSLKGNFSVTRVDLEPFIKNEGAEFQKDYMGLLLQLEEYCSRNKQIMDEKAKKRVEAEQFLQVFSPQRKVSLTCEITAALQEHIAELGVLEEVSSSENRTSGLLSPILVPEATTKKRLVSPDPSPCPSPSPLGSPSPSPSPTQSRRKFQVSVVRENNTPASTGRFTVSNTSTSTGRFTVSNTSASTGRFTVSKAASCGEGLNVINQDSPRSSRFRVARVEEPKLSASAPAREFIPPAPPSPSSRFVVTKVSADTNPKPNPVIVVSKSVPRVGFDVSPTEVTNEQYTISEVEEKVDEASATTNGNVVTQEDTLLNNSIMEHEQLNGNEATNTDKENDNDTDDERLLNDSDSSQHQREDKHNQKGGAEAAKEPINMCIKEEPSILQDMSSSFNQMNVS